MGEIASIQVKIAWFMALKTLHEGQGRHYPEDLPCGATKEKAVFPLLQSHDGAAAQAPLAA